MFPSQELYVNINADNDGNIYFSTNCKIRKIIESPVYINRDFAGTSQCGHRDGVGTFAMLNAPSFSTFDRNNNMWVADRNNFAIRKISNHGDVTTIAGNIKYYFSLVETYKVTNSSMIDGYGTYANFSSLKLIFWQATLFYYTFANYSIFS
jgi:hypothetical protein